MATLSVTKLTIPQGEGTQPPAIRTVNAFSVDVEDWFQVQAFAAHIDPATWDSLPCRVEANMDRLLALCAEAGIHGTFFTLGWIAQRYPQVVRAIVTAGHELASHGDNHQLVHALTPSLFEADVTRAKAILEDIGGVAVSGYRAPTFSIGRTNPWAWAVLEQTGHTYSSSVYPVRHDLYGDPAAPRFPYRPTSGSLLEIPMTTLMLGGRNLPISGGGYFRLMPYALYRHLLSRFHRQSAAASVFYIHPWEIDPGQPRVTATSRLSRFRHTINLGRTATRLQALMHDFAWGRIDRVFAPDLARASLIKS